MRRLEIVDLKGDTCALILVPLEATRSKRGLIEVWYQVKKDWLPEYPAIPIPLFNEWWP